MSTTTTVKPFLSDVPQGRLAMWFLIAGELMIFGGLIACYLLYRFRFPEEWSAQAEHQNQYLGILNTIILLSSSFFVVKGHEAATKGDHKAIGKWIGFTILCAVGFLCVKAVEYTHEIGEGFTFVSQGMIDKGEHVASLYWSFYYILTGLHGLHVIAGAIALLVVMLAARKGKEVHRVEVAGLYWHMVDLVWIFLFPILYLAN